MKTVEFNMMWTSYGRVYVDVPDNLDVSDRAAVVKYLNDHISEYEFPDKEDGFENIWVDEESEIRIDGELV